MLKFLFNRKKQRPVSAFFNVGFHGDSHLLKIVDFMVAKNVVNFIETGTNVGTTIAYVAKKYPHVQCFSCEPDATAFAESLKNTTDLPNVKIFQDLSQDFLDKILRGYPETFQQKTLFWIDAHGYGFDWPLKKEINFILTHYSQAYLLIDDFKVPHLDAFEYDQYQEQICSFDFIKEAIPPVSYELYYPNYTEKTSTHHGLRGWGLFITGEQDTFDTFESKDLIINSKRLLNEGNL
jgi:hypothetical protein